MFRHPVALLELLDKGERVLYLVTLHHLTIGLDGHFKTIHPQQSAAG